ncbi:MAG: TolC family protein [Gammaproteobacteria bacterium]|nr:TolC family protein [Gammaproteobacteria bacterium]
MRATLPSRWRVPLLALAAAALVTRGAAAETLGQAWQMAIANNQALAAAHDEVEGARAKERAARGGRWPTVDTSVGYTRLNAAPQLDVVTPGFTFRSGPIFKDDQYVSGTVQVKVPLYAGGRITAGIRAARESLTGVSAQEQAALSDLKLAVAEAYVGVLRARSELAVADSSVASLRAHVSDAKSMFQRQLVAKSDLLAAQVALAVAEERQVSAANGVQIALADYNRLLGEPLERAPRLEGRLDIAPALATEAVGSLVRRALAARGELKGLAAQSSALAAQARAATGSRLPQVALTGGYTHFDNQILDRQNFSMVGVGFTWRLFDGGVARDEADSLRSESRAAGRRLADQRSQVELQVRQAWLAVRAAHARVAASREATAQAAENLRISRELYGAGLASNTQVLDAVTLQVQATNDHDNAMLDESLAGMELEYAVGAL